jgi:chromate reductase
MGGSRAQYDLRRILSGLGVLWVARPEVFIGMSASKFAEGRLTDETTRKFITDLMAGLEDWTRRMKRAFG